MITEFKFCKACNTEKSIEDFYKSRKGCKKGCVARCKKCHYKQTLQWKLKNKEKIPDYHRKHGLKGRYGISLQDFENIKYLQNYGCAICGEIPDKNKPKQSNKLHVDHCHQTGKVRGLLCHLCNRGIGLFRENKELLKKAIDYLTFH